MMDEMMDDILAKAVGDFAQKLQDEYDMLIEMTRLIQEGKSNKEIKQHLDVTYAQIKMHRRRVRSGWRVEVEGEALKRKHAKMLEGAAGSLVRAKHTRDLPDEREKP
jgi:ATP/maltotriose-dependent transcriptional regulator MalT